MVDGCWPWTGALSEQGYGLRGGKPAHRLAYLESFGPIPKGMHVDHMCHNEDQTCPGGKTCPHRRCVNPAHLRLATPRENTRAGRRSFAGQGRVVASPYPDHDGDVLTAIEVGAALNLGPRTIQRMASAGELPTLQKLPGRTGQYLFSRAVVEFIASQQEEKAS